MQLIKVSVTLDAIEKPLDPPWRRHAAKILFGVALFACAFGSGAKSDLIAIAAVPVFFAALILSSRSWIFLPAAARRFRAATRDEHRELVRRTEAFNRAWCLAERIGKTGTEDPHDPFLSRFTALKAEVDAYVARYRIAAADDLARVGADTGRRSARQEIVDRSNDLVELEAKLDELGKDADPGMRTRARTLREALEKDCIKGGFDLGIVRRARASRPPALPTAKVISEGRP